jgi:hypothetical protein
MTVLVLNKMPADHSGRQAIGATADCAAEKPAAPFRPALPYGLRDRARRRAPENRSAAG